MRRFLQHLLTKPVIKLANRLSSRPDEKRVHEALSGLYQAIHAKPAKKGLIIPVDAAQHKFVVLSDQHKGIRNGADIFAKAEKNYLQALDFYLNEGFFYINLGDSEELWENSLANVRKFNTKTFEHENKFLSKKCFVKIFGNHDLYWDNDPLAGVNLKSIYGTDVTIYEGIILQTTVNEIPLEIFMTHGHQGDLQSDGNWFSKWFVANVWAPFQSYLQINPNTPSTNNELKTAHNRMMYEWSAKQNAMLLLTGHTHQPVFKSFTEIESLYNKLAQAKQNSDERLIAELQAKGDQLPDFSYYLDTYFNSGCCCFDDGDITGIEIADNSIRLIKWGNSGTDTSLRRILEESRLDELKINRLPLEQENK
jgi:predicted phosphodiesterase